MGSWNYYIEIKVNTLTLDYMISEYKQNQTYQKAFSFGKLENGHSGGYNAVFVSIVDNFLPTNHLIYSFLTNYRSYDLRIKANNTERSFDFVQRAEFIKFMYDAWESKIDFVYEQLGVIVINHKLYQKTRSKLYKKHYIKIPRDDEDRGRFSVSKE